MNSEEFKKFIDSEISYLRDEILRPGWTSWALIGAVAGLAWVLTSLVESGQYSLKNVAGILVVIWFLDYSYFFIKNCISPNASNSSSSQFIPTHLLSATRMGILFLICQLGFMFYVVHEFAPDVGGIASGAAFTALVVLIFSSLGALIISLIRYPLPKYISNRNTIIIPILFSVIMLIPVWYYSRFLWINPGDANVYDVKFALVIAAIYYLISKLLAEQSGVLTLDILSTIRREWLSSLLVAFMI